MVGLASRDVSLALLNPGLSLVGLLDVLHLACLCDDLVQFFDELSVTALSCDLKSLQMHVHLLFLSVILFNILTGESNFFSFFFLASNWLFDVDVIFNFNLLLFIIEKLNGILRK